jgi:hypothetical protein
MTEQESSHEESEKDSAASTSFTLTVSLISWVYEESKRRGLRSKSALVKEILEAARSESQAAA